MKKVLNFILFLFAFIQLYSVRYNIKNYTIDDGLIDREVQTIFEDSKGNIWIGTFSGGINKFDGEKFINYTKIDGLPDVFVGSIAEDKNGNIWFGTMGGLCKFDGENFINYRKGKNKTYYVRTIEIDDENNLWLSTSKGLTKFNPINCEFKNFKERKYPEYIFTVIDSLRSNNAIISSIIKVGDNQNINKKFTIREKKEVLIVASGESVFEMDDYGPLCQDDTGHFSTLI